MIGNDERLRNRLPMTNRQRTVHVGKRAHSGGDEFVTRHLRHGFENVGIGYPPSHQLILHHSFS